MLTDPVADMLTRIRNANSAFHESVTIPHSKLKAHVAQVLLEQGYIAGHRTEPAAVGKNLIVDLKYGRGRERVLTDLKRVSKPGRRVYANKDRMPRVLGGMGTAILSTSRGICSSRTAQQNGVGGEVICFVW